ncbi:thermostable hemolysin [Pseudoalteromonas piscicida]|uniref:Thermostable hemolysin n=1 Tax=Pseudoalteromonas piscicida TaxID=43662 RepID=A0AAD0W6M3_PSEO7|nr:thermostable hemolysin [Pseudoalteromonas piscicida]ASD69527.1 thermostable hemolysin [Pseudoalteromonas piscicida]AXR00138.1 thermostable hemolysin [Pseudoalteromonas piscicida]AXR04113.1 thermostable hemolysin [Pseudoalteromonas piscicida]
MGEALQAVNSQSRLRWANKTCGARGELEHAIHSGFAHAFGADIHEYYPLLSHLNYRQSDCFLGLRFATKDALFVEQYLNCPVEQCLSMVAERSHIAELGNLFSTGRMATLSHFIVLTQALLESDIRYLVFTATKQVRALMKLCQVEVNKISLAHGTIASAKDYGSYYQCAPMVCSVDLHQAQQVITNTEMYQHLLQGLKMEIASLKEAFLYV